MFLIAWRKSPILWHHGMKGEGGFKGLDVAPLPFAVKQLTPARSSLLLFWPEASVVFFFNYFSMGFRQVDFPKPEYHFLEPLVLRLTGK